MMAPIGFAAVNIDTTTINTGREILLKIIIGSLLLITIWRYLRQRPIRGVVVICWRTYLILHGHEDMRTMKERWKNDEYDESK